MGWAGKPGDGGTGPAGGRQGKGQVARVTVIGECTLSRTLPLPRYMCTPHGRHGSKLRTARMMSIPLNLSGGFSSKIGVFCTASSYGPGVPKLSRTLAFQGVGDESRVACWRSGVRIFHSSFEGREELRVVTAFFRRGALECFSDHVGWGHLGSE